MSCIIHGANARPLGRLERVSGIEPPSSAWKADIMLLYANWSADVPVFARFVLPVATTEDDFDAEGYIKMGER
jgi:hypothetical protein